MRGYRRGWRPFEGSSGDPGVLLARRWQRSLIRKNLHAPLELLLGHFREVDGELLADGHPTLHAGTRAEIVEPTFHVLELVDVLAERLPIQRPGIAHDVGDRIALSGQVAAVVKPIVQDAEQPVHFIVEAPYGVRQVAVLRFLRGAAEVPALAELWALV